VKAKTRLVHSLRESSGVPLLRQEKRRPDSYYLHHDDWGKTFLLLPPPLSEVADTKVPSFTLPQKRSTNQVFVPPAQKTSGKKNGGDADHLFPRERVLSCQKNLLKSSPIILTKKRGSSIGPIPCAQQKVGQGKDRPPRLLRHLEAHRGEKNLASTLCV